MIFFIIVCIIVFGSAEWWYFLVAVLIVIAVIVVISCICCCCCPCCVICKCCKCIKNTLCCCCKDDDWCWWRHVAMETANTVPADLHGGAIVPSTPISLMYKLWVKNPCQLYFWKICKTILTAFCLWCISCCCKTAKKSKFCPKIQHTEAVAITFCASHWPVTNVKAMFVLWILIFAFLAMFIYQRQTVVSFVSSFLQF